MKDYSRAVSGSLRRVRSGINVKPCYDGRRGVPTVSTQELSGFPHQELQDSQDSSQTPRTKNSQIPLIRSSDSSHQELRFLTINRALRVSCNSHIHELSDSSGEGLSDSSREEP